MQQRPITGRTEPGVWDGARWDWTSVIWYKSDKNYLLEAQRTEDEWSGHWTYWRNGDQYVVTHDGVTVETNGKRLGHGTTYTYGIWQACVCAALDKAYGDEFTGYAHNYRLHRDCARENND